MVYITAWNEFQEAAEALYTKSPTRTRYVVKWKPSQGVLVLKITDDETCLKFRTHSSIMLGRFETLNLELMRKMQNRTAPPADLAVAAPSERALTPVPGVAFATAAAASTAAGGGVKKKKPKKKK
ncbi:signal recognition particle, SRP9/SRP14 subunit [Ceratobasidium sp. AG-I]|nr:signal recognition particle, SRP9/SRP14 subunit [Ceratobasidium sp. AG-I]